MKAVSERQSKRIKKLAKIAPPKDGKCQRCGEYPDFRGLQKHHKVARSQGGKDTPDNLEWLCGKCHGEKHHTENMPKSKPVDRPLVLSGHGTGYGTYWKWQQTGSKPENK